MADMRKSKFAEEQIIGLFKQAAAGLAVVDICCKVVLSEVTSCKWHAKFDGLQRPDAAVATAALESC